VQALLMARVKDLVLDLDDCTPEVMCVCVCVYAHSSIQVCLWGKRHLCIMYVCSLHVCVYACVCIYVCKYMYIHSHICLHASMYVSIYVCKRKCDK